MVPGPSYGKFAEFYDELTGNISYVQRAQYFHELLKRYGPKQNTEDILLLDLACGTGSLSFALSDLGYDVIGVDASGEMLSVAMQKNMQRASPLLFLCQTMQELELYGSIDGAICALDSLNHLTNPQDVQEALERVSLFFSQDAVLIFDVNTPYKHEQVLGNQVFVYDCEDVYCVWQNTYHASTRVVDISLDFFEEEDGAYFRSSEQFSERAYTHEEICGFLENAGMVLVDFFAADTLEKPGSDTQRVVYVAKNRHLKQKTQG